MMQPEAGPCTPLQRRQLERRAQREALRLETLASLRRALSEVLPGEAVYVYGSLVKPGRFHQRSDIDLALERAPVGRSVYRVQAELEDRLLRPVDLCVLGETRLRAKIEAEGERWAS